jgi:2-dehydro-3-deoxyglucarate aldolase
MLHSIRNKLKGGRCTIGSWLQIPSSTVAAIMGKAGYDWVAIDLEHGAFSLQALPDIFRALREGGTVPMVRLARAESKDIRQALDAGAMGIILPMIESREQLEFAVSQAFYPPKGVRGVGYCNANAYGQHFNEYASGSARKIFIVAQIEHIRAVEALDDILTVDGLDAVMIGPYDLSASMGLTGQFDHPDFQKALATYRAKATEHGVPFGFHVVQPDETMLNEKIAEGYQFIAYSIDTVFLYANAQCPKIQEPGGR